MTRQNGFKFKISKWIIIELKQIGTLWTENWMNSGHQYITLVDLWCHEQIESYSELQPKTSALGVIDFYHNIQ